MKERPELRVFVPWVALLIIAFTTARSAPFRSLADLTSRLPRLVAEHDADDPNRAALWFDPEYGPFLKALRRSTPENATVAILAPRTIDLYVYCSVYELVPRRVVGSKEIEEAEFVAVYHAEPPADLPRGTAIPGGTLLRR